jgi:hypothetical protein
LPWVDYQRSYQGVALEIRKVLGQDDECLRAINISEAQFAALDYYLDNALRRTPAERQACRLLVTTGAAELEDSWKLIWEGTRPGDKTERYQLYRRQ